MRITRAIFSFLAVIIFITGCTKQITVEEALTEEYFTMAPSAYQGKDRELRKADAESLNLLFRTTYRWSNFALARYYLTLGANLLEVEDLNREHYIITLSRGVMDDDRRELLIESFSRFPEISSWKIEFGNGTTDSALTHLAFVLSSEDFLSVVQVCDDVNVLDEYGQTVLMNLASRLDSVIEKKEKIQILLNAGTDVSHITPKGQNILHYFNWWPIEANYSEVLKIIMQSAVDVNKQDTNGETPLHFAVYPVLFGTNGPAYVRFLLENGADKNIANNNGVLPWQAVGRYERWFGNATPEEVAARKEIMAELTAMLK